MKYKDKTVCVVDDGIFISVAHRLAEDFGKVYYYSQWKSSFPTILDSSIGDGYDDFEKIDDFWMRINEIDVFVFPGIMDGDLQLHLKSLGKLVWGSTEGEMLEVDRWAFLKYLEKLGLNIPPSELIVGIDELQKKLEKNDNLYVKCDSTTRGSFETFFHKSWNLTRPLIDKIRYNLGPLATKVKFVVQEPIDGDLEYGFDTWMVNGEFPETIQYGFEIKELGYVCKVMEFDKMDKGIVEIFDKLKPTFKAYNYTGPFSAELRKDESGKFYFTDACCRCANPATFAMVLLCSNYAEIIVEGCNGNLIEPKWNAKFGGEITINSEFLSDNFGELFYPESIKPFINRMNCCKIDGVEWNIPNGHTARKLDSYGSVAAIDNNPDKMIETLMKRIDMISGFKVSIDNKNLDVALEKLKS